MYNEKIIQKLETIFDNIEKETSYLDYNSSNMILERKRVVQYLDKLFLNVEAVKEENINAITTKKTLRSVIRLYLIRNNKAIIKEEKVVISDLSKEMRRYKNDISKNSKYDEEEIEKILENKSNEKLNSIMNKLLNYVFTLVLSSSTDEKMFEELIGEANETLLSSIYNYDKKKHNNFKNYLTYNIEILIIKKQNKIINENKYKTSFAYADKYEDRIIERVDNIRLLKEIMKKAHLSTLEKEIIEYIYGLTDGMPHTYEEAAREFHINKIGATHLGTEALIKLKMVKK